ncbi:MAG: hypothetical protein LC749_19350 [Actinobacteria bacterium]|nr:hypothetical protein [Actinomycetota bacterium]
MAETWTVIELQQELRRFESELRAAKLADSSVRTYVDRSERFVRWLAGDYQPQGPRS